MFQKATRSASKLKLAMTGPSGSGKTMSSLILAKALGSKIAVIDTENGSASLYADRFEFDTLLLKPPYTVKKYQDAIKAAVDAKYDCLVIDSITHLWAGEGGLLAKKEALDQRGGNSFANWAGISKEHEAFKSWLLHAPVHTICTMRSKQEYALTNSDQGKAQVRKLGMAPIQRDGMEYEFTVVFDLGMDHSASVSKDRTSLFDGQIFQITADTGETLKQWLESSSPVPPPPLNSKQDQDRDSSLKKETIDDQNRIQPPNIADHSGPRPNSERNEQVRPVQSDSQKDLQGAGGTRSTELPNYADAEPDYYKPSPDQHARPPKLASEKQIKFLFAIGYKSGFNDSQIMEIIRVKGKAKSIKELDAMAVSEIKKFIDVTTPLNYYQLMYRDDPKPPARPPQTVDPQGIAEPPYPQFDPNEPIPF